MPADPINQNFLCDSSHGPIVTQLNRYFSIVQNIRLVNRVVCITINIHSGGRERRRVRSMYINERVHG